MPADAARAKPVFLAASDLADPGERAAYLDRECAGQPDLRARVEALLRADADAPPPDPVPADATATFGPAEAEPTADYPGRDAHAGAVIGGKYTLVELVGEGGMGSVWRAKQTEPVKRFVAVKLIKAGMDSRQVLARFEAERQALAVMDHPNIAKVLDGGLHDGRPYFVMELVKGVPITAYCDARKLTPRERLELFVPVCQAIQHAHQKGIIHRDIKPSNVLVALYDDKPVPKVIDFGLAKATGGGLTDLSAHTAFGGVVGSPQYMSPEQASLNNLDIDTRSDVYSLGVLLYELLAGSPPFRTEELKRAGLMEMLRVVREAEPPRPSTKLSTAEALPSLSASRGTDPKRLTGLLRNELDWIVMKALEKDRARRYETANGFAADVARYLAGDAVLAHPPSAAYRVRKFVRRHKGQVVAAGLVLVALLAGMAGTTAALVEAKKQERLAVAAQAAEAERAEGERLARLDAQGKEQLAVAAAAKERLATELTAARLAQIETINSTVFDIFAEFDIRKVKEGKDPVEYVLARKIIAAGKKLDAKAIHDPLVLANLQTRLGETLLNLGEAAAAVELLAAAAEVRRARLGRDHPDTLTSMGNLATGYQMTGKLDKALPLYEETLALRKAKLGPDHPDTLTSMDNLARGYLMTGKLDKALPLYEETLALRKAKLGPDHPDTLTSMDNLATGYLMTGKPDKALPLYEGSLALQKAKLGPDHPNTLQSMNGLAVAYQNTGKADKALPLLEETLALRKAKLGPDHPDTLTSMNNLAVAYRETGKPDKALPLHEETLALMKAKLGPDRPDTLASMNNLAVAYRETGKPDKALPLHEETLALMKAKQGPDHPDTLASMNSLAVCYWLLERLDKSVPLYGELLPIQERKLGRQHPETLNTVANLGVNYKDAGRLEEAVPLLEEAYRASKKHAPLRWVSVQLLDAYAKAGKADKLAELCRESLADARRTLPAGSPELANLLAVTGTILLEQKQWADAEPLFRECLAICEKTQPDLWQTFNSRSALGGALLGQKEYAGAERLLLKGYEGMKRREKAIPPRNSTLIPDALDRLVELTAATDKPDEAAKWRAERAKYPSPREVAPPPREKR